MAKLPPRYNSGVQRAKGLLEMAAGLYDTSLSTLSTRSGSPAPQIASRVGAKLELTLGAEDAGPGDGRLPVAFGVDGLKQNILDIVSRKLTLLWVNPNATLAQAYKGCPPFDRKLPVRAIASFPSWDATVIAVHESTGITSIEQIRERRVPLKVSTRREVTPPFDENATMFAVTSICAAAGFSFDDLRAWGGEFHGVARPSHPDRARDIEAGRVNAVFDEGILSWGNFALEHGFRFLTLEGEVRRRVEAAGYDIVTVTEKRLPALKAPIQSVDFCGWPMIVNAELDDAVAYALCETLEGRKLAIPTDNYKPMDLAQLCSITEETPRGAPLHPGAERFYRERGYLK